MPSSLWGGSGLRSVGLIRWRTCWPWKKTPTQIRTGPQDVQMPGGLTWDFETLKREILMNISLSLNYPHIHTDFDIFQHFHSQCRDLQNVETSLFTRKIRANVSCTSPGVCPAMRENIMERTRLTSPQGWHLKVSQSFPCQEPRKLAMKCWMLIFMGAVKSKLRWWQIG